MSGTAPLRPITAVAETLGLTGDDLEQYGPFKAKLSLPAIQRAQERPPGRLIVMTAMTPTPPGEGKTTVGIGLAMALQRLGHTACACLREPSLGPLFGMKGGATGGGRATLEPAEEINLHFTGDLHAVTAAQNLLAALVDNHLYHGNALGIDPATLSSYRSLDICDRSLRRIALLSEPGSRETRFELTAASEMMATLIFTEGIADLKERLARIVIGFRDTGEPVRLGDLRSVGGLAALLRDAIKPNLVQTREGTPALLHLGPFGNVSCGANSVLATRLGRHLADYAVTEAGFATDLGFEKFCHLIAPAGGFTADAAVLVATIRALKYHGGVPLERLGDRDHRALAAGFTNLRQHIENVKTFGLPCVVALNQFCDDRPEEIAQVRALCEEQKVTCASTTVWEYGGRGGRELAEAVVEAARQPNRFRPLSEPEWPLTRKLDTIARTLYGADGVQLLPEAQEKLARLQVAGLDRLPLCMAKTHLSLSDDAQLLGRPRGFTVTIRDLRLMAGAGFIVCYAGKILTMPGLPKSPAAERMDVTENGQIIGLA